MKIAFTFFLSLCSAALYAADGPEIRNGTFENGKQYWRGNGKVVTLPDGGKVCELKSSERYNDQMSQEVDFGKSTEVEVTLRMKGLSYQGEGLRVEWKRRTGFYTYMTRPIATDGSWTELKWKYTRTADDDKLTLTLSPAKGKGSIQIDDVKVTSLSTTPAKPE